MPGSYRWLPAAACAVLLRFTMMIRVNKPWSVDAYAELQSTYDQLRPRDIFVVNTRFKGSSPRHAGGDRRPASRLLPLQPDRRAERTWADPRRPGYARSLIDSPGTWAVLLDGERRDWGRARATIPRLSRWKRRFGRAASCLRAALAGGGGAVLFWASPESIWALVQTHHFRKLRHRR
jgi:hypothetical protein